MTGRTGAFSSFKQYRCQTGVFGGMDDAPPCRDGRGRPLGPPRAGERRGGNGPPPPRHNVPKPLIYRGGAFPVAAPATARGPAPVGPGRIAGRDRPGRKIPPAETTARGVIRIPERPGHPECVKKATAARRRFFCPGSVTWRGAARCFMPRPRDAGRGPPRCFLPRSGQAGRGRPTVREKVRRGRWGDAHIGPSRRPRKPRFSDVRALTRRSKYFLTSGED